MCSLDWNGNPGKGYVHLLCFGEEEIVAMIKVHYQLLGVYDNVGGSSGGGWVGKG
jgi:hypothetical protein